MTTAAQREADRQKAIKACREATKALPVSSMTTAELWAFTYFARAIVEREATEVAAGVQTDPPPPVLTLHRGGDQR